MQVRLFTRCLFMFSGEQDLFERTTTRLQAVFEELTYHFMLQIAGYHVFHWLLVLNRAPMVKQSGCTARREWLTIQEKPHCLHSSREGAVRARGSRARHVAANSDRTKAVGLEPRNSENSFSLRRVDTQRKDLQLQAYSLHQRAHL